VKAPRPIYWFWMVILVLLLLPVMESAPWWWGLPYFVVISFGPLTIYVIEEQVSEHRKRLDEIHDKLISIDRRIDDIIDVLPRKPTKW